MRTQTKRQVKQSVHELTNELSHRLDELKTYYAQMDEAKKKKLMVAMSAAVGAIAGTILAVKKGRGKKEDL